MLRTLASMALLLTCLMASGCGGSAPYNYAREPDPRKAEYEIGPLDVLKVVVWKNAELSADVAVRPDGVVTLPLIGNVNAAGRTPTDLKDDIAKRYAAFVRLEESAVSVGVKEVNSYYFTVSGSVEKSGVYFAKNYVTVLEAIATAGGPNKYASKNAHIIRKQRKIPIDLKRAASGEHIEENLVVIRGDVIVVPN